MTLDEKLRTQFHEIAGRLEIDPDAELGTTLLSARRRKRYKTAVTALGGLVVVILAAGVTTIAMTSFGTQKVGTANRPTSETDRGLTPEGELAAVTQLANNARNLPREEVERLEDELKAHPNDLDSRTRLLGYYWAKRNSDEADEARRRHALWVIKNRPESVIAGLPYAHLDPLLDGDAYIDARALWIKHAEDTTSVKVITNAANFFTVIDRKRAEALFIRAKELDPENPEWSARLGTLYMLGLSRREGQSRIEEAKKALAEFERALSLTKNQSHPSPPHHLLTNAATAAFEAGDISKARQHATDLLNDAGRSPNGNPVHYGNLILGRIALLEGDVGETERRLLAAGRTSGSPNLNSFGPNMTLARDLLRRGRKDVVLEYLNLCAVFWKSGQSKLTVWKEDIRAGREPDFGANLDY